MSEKTPIKVVNSLDKQKWSDFVKNHPHGNIFQTPEMYEVYENTKRYAPIFLVAVDESDDIQALLLAHVIKEFDGLLGSFSSRSIIQGGPLSIESEVGKEALKLLLQEYNKIARKKALYTQIRNLYGMSKFNDVFLQHGYKYEDHLNFLIDLNKSEKELFSALNKKRRYGVRKAEKAGVVIREVNDHDELFSAYSLLQQTYKSAKLPLADFSLFESAFKILSVKNMIKIFIAHKNERDIASIFLLMSNRTIYDWCAGASSEHLNLYPNDLTTWHAIKYGAIANPKYHTFDFGGAGKPNEDYGIRDFKKQFGGKLVNYGRYEKIYSPIKMRIAKGGFDIWRKLHK